MTACVRRTERTLTHFTDLVQNSDFFLKMPLRALKKKKRKKSKDIFSFSMSQRPYGGDSIGYQQPRTNLLWPLIVMFIT